MRASTAPTSCSAGACPDAFKTEVARELEARVWPLFAQGRLKPVVGEVLPLAQAVQAHRLMERAGHWGKIVLRA